MFITFLIIYITIYQYWKIKTFTDKISIYKQNLEVISSNLQRYKYELGIIEKFPIINTREINIKIGCKIKIIKNDKNAILKLNAHIIEFLNKYQAIKNQ